MTTKPWEEACEWYVEDGVHVLSERTTGANVYEVTEVATCARPDDARLASAAPDLVRALLAVESLIDTDPETWVRLPMEARVALRAALRKAGVR